MKHTLFTIMALMAFAIGAMAEEVEIQTKEGKKYNGELRGRTDSTLTIYNRYALKTYTFYADEIVEANTAQGGRFTVENGKIVGNSYEELYMRRKEEEKVRMGDPNYAIGKALKTSGAIGMAVGVPCFVLGSILVIAGQSGSKSIVDNPTSATVKEAIRYSDCTVAGLIFMPLGGALTIIGAPLYSHGKKILDLSVQVSENGPGVAVRL